VPPTKDEFRQVMGYFATGVTIVTTAHAGTVRGMTANSICSVSLDPLSVLVCVNREAITYGILEAGKVFCVNVLSEEQEALSRACARPDTPEAELKGVSYRLGQTGAPILDGALAYLDCRVSASMDFGTHRIYVGETVDIGSEDSRPLLFYRGKYLRAPENLPV
jgi:flavin reductase (DIM6/NTAB) family NADH-FMN oxidoreductase RutF